MKYLVGVWCMMNSLGIAIVEERWLVECQRNT